MNFDGLRFRYDDPDSLRVSIARDARMETLENRALAENLRVGPRVLPRVHEALCHAARALGVTQPVSAFVLPGPEANAYCLKERTSGRILVFLTSSIVRQLSPPELRFLFGHELGHVQFRHFRYPSARQVSEQHPVPARVLELHRYAEISADRAGWVVIEDTDVALKAMLKLASGLLDGELDVDLGEFMGQVQELRQGPGDETILYATHPPLTVRARALLRAETLMRAIIAGEDRTAELQAVDQLIQREIDAAACGEERGGIAERGRVAAFWRAARCLCADGELSRGEQAVLLEEFGEDRVDALRRILRQASSREAALSQLDEKVAKSRAEVDAAPSLVERVLEETLTRLRPRIPGL